MDDTVYVDFLTRYKYSGLLLLLAGLIVGYVLGQARLEGALDTIKDSFTPIEEVGTSYSFVHPLLAYRVPEATTFGDYVSLKDSLQSIIDSEMHTHPTMQASLYFRDLRAARWVGISQDNPFYPASLLKVPTMVAYLKEAEENPIILNTSIAYDPRVMPTEPFITPSALITSRAYTMQELIDQMIVNSDNGATFTLLSRINPEFLHAVYVALGIQDPGDDSSNYKISARTYGLFFRVLYNSTYLSPRYSERALKILSQTTFVDGLVAGVPKGTVVSHKYGEHVFSQNGAATGVELSDCGIIYYPEHPYLLCVMVNAKDTLVASALIAKISRTVYDAVGREYVAANSSQ